MNQPTCQICGATYCEIYGCVHFYPETCTTPPRCKMCGTPNGTKGDHHVYDYTKPQKLSDNVVLYPCSNQDYTASYRHTHEFVNRGANLNPEYTYMQIPGDYLRHERQYYEPQECSADYCDETRNAIRTETVSHSWGKETVGLPATCEKDGYNIQTCKDCQLEKKTSTITHLGHKYNHNAPRIKSDLVVHYPCSNPGCTAYEYHKHYFVNKDTTMTPTGVYVQIPGNYSKHETQYTQKQKCDAASYCKITRDAIKTKNEAHKWKGWQTTKKATCASTGKKQHTCSLCGITEKVTIPKEDHSWGAGVLVELPTATSPAKVKYICTKCGTPEIRDVK